MMKIPRKFSLRTGLVAVLASMAFAVAPRYSVRYESVSSHDAIPRAVVVRKIEFPYAPFVKQVDENMVFSSGSPQQAGPQGSWTTPTDVWTEYHSFDGKTCDTIEQSGITLFGILIREPRCFRRNNMSSDATERCVYADRTIQASVKCYDGSNPATWPDANTIPKHYVQENNSELK